MSLTTKYNTCFFIVDVVVDKVQPMVGWTLHCAPLNYIDSIFKV